MPASAPPAGGTPIPGSVPGSQSPPTPGTPNPNPPPTDKSVDTPLKQSGAGVPEEELRRLRELNAAQEATLRDYHRQNTELTQRLRGLDERVKKVEAPPGPSEDEVNQEFWKNPSGVMSRLIKEEMARTVGPLNERLSQQTQMSEYERTKQRLKAEYSDIWDKIEGSVDEFVRNASAQGVEINDQVMTVAALTASGMYYRGQIPGAPPAAPRASEPKKEEERPTTVFTPPHLRPSAPPIPGTEPAKKELRDLTENEKRLARERGMTTEQYLQWLDVPPEGVIASKIGRKEGE